LCWLIANDLPPMSDQPSPRIVTLVLVGADGVVLGAMAPFVADTPWWMDMTPVVKQVRVNHGIDVAVLRLLNTALPSAHGGAVTYLAELLASHSPSLPSLQGWDGELHDDPKRVPYAKVGGPSDDLAWATDVLRAQNIKVNGLPQQTRTWNLSSIWTIPTHVGPVWLKVVPPFFAHEGGVIQALSASGSLAVPTVLGHEGGRLLLANVAGSDRYDADVRERCAIIDQLVEIQRSWFDRIDELCALDAPDWRATNFIQAVGDLLDRRSGTGATVDREILSAFLTDLPDRFAAIATCGIPDSVVHGDFHPGNVRGPAMDDLVILDWGDSGIGHPLLDQPAMLSSSRTEDIATLRNHWSASWRAAVPRSDPSRAAQLLEPIAAMRQALIYQKFLDGIEATEHGYHAADVGLWLHNCVGVLRGEVLRSEGMLGEVLRAEHPS
jgi:hypothetical protein